MSVTADMSFPRVGDGSFIEPSDRFHQEELQLALRNHAVPLEALRYDVTPPGLHYTLIHYDIPAVDVPAWRLTIGGAVHRQLTLSLEDLRRRPQTTLRVTLECAGDGRALSRPRPISQPWLLGAVGTADWTGTSLSAILRESQVASGAREVLFTGLDEGFEGGQRQWYERSLPLDEAMRDDVILAWAMNGAPVAPQHGFPLRLIAPGWYGMAHVKWLRSIRLLDHEFTGYQQSTAYRYASTREAVGEPVTLMRVRSVMIPPGIPDFLTRTRVVQRGPVQLSGRAWSGRSAIRGVAVSLDGGTSWEDAEVVPQSGPHQWQSWRYDWSAVPGSYQLCCRATDATGNAQPVEQFWTARGMGNNLVQRIPVIVV